MDNKQKQKKYLKYFRRGGKILELGSGRGDFLELCSENGYKVTGVDNVMPGARGRFKFVKSTIEKFLKSNRGVKFSGIYMRHVVEHFWPEELAEVFKKCSKLLEKEGKIVVIFPNTNNMIVAIRDFWSDETHTRPYTIRSLENIASKSGLEMEESGADRESWGAGILRSTVRTFRRIITGIPQEPPDCYVVFFKGENNA